MLGAPIVCGGCVWSWFCHIVFCILSFIISIRQNIRIHRECEGEIEDSVMRINDCHHEACRVMTIIIGDGEGRIFLSHPYTNNGFFFLFNTKYLILLEKT